MYLETTGTVSDFIKAFNLPVDIASVLFENYEDCNLFFTKFYIKNKFAIDDLLDFREYKIDNNYKTLPTFLNECSTKGLKQTFEKTFFQSFTLEDINIISQALLDDKTTLEQIYNNFQKNPDKNIMRYVL